MMQKKQKTPSLLLSQQKLRIIAGKWRGRKIQFLAESGLRPTSERIRETLFNWLNTEIADAVCLDLFAGSGLLGLEALSRGAKQVYFVEQNPKLIQALKKIALTWQIPKEKALFFTKSVPSLDLKKKQYFNIVFLDPPFQSNLLEKSISYLEQSILLTKTAFIYLETDKTCNLPIFPPHWALIKDKIAGQVRYCLLRVEK